MCTEVRNSPIGSRGRHETRLSGTAGCHETLSRNRFGGRPGEVLEPTAAASVVRPGELVEVRRLDPQFSSVSRQSIAVGSPLATAVAGTQTAAQPNLQAIQQPQPALAVPMVAVPPEI